MLTQNYSARNPEVSQDIYKAIMRLKKRILTKSEPTKSAGPLTQALILTYTLTMAFNLALWQITVLMSDCTLPPCGT